MTAGQMARTAPAAGGAAGARMFQIADLTGRKDDTSLLPAFVQELKAAGFTAEVKPGQIEVEEIAAGLVDTSALILYDRAETAIAHAAEQRQPPSAALKDWEAHARALLNLLRRNRGRVILIDGVSFHLAPRKFLDRFCQHLGAEAPSGERLKATKTPGDPVHRLIAQQVLAEAIGLRALNEELEASSLLFEPDTVRVTTGEAWMHYDVQTAQAALLRDDIARYQVAAERNASDREQLETLNLLMRTLQEEAERSQKRMRGLQGEVRRKDDELNALWASTSWRVTAPLRRIKQALSGRGKE